MLPMSIRGWLGLLLMLVLGGVSTAIWLRTIPPELFLTSIGFRTVLSLVLLASCATLLNLLLRWLRWHFLLRRFTREVRARDSFKVYCATLAFQATPFCVGELIRVPLLQRHYPLSGLPIASTWLFERLADTGIMVIFLAAPLEPPISIAAILCVFLLLHFIGLGWFRQVVTDVGSWSIKRTAFVLLLSGIAWGVVALGFHAVLTILGASASLGVAGASFAAGTLAGGVAGIPLGMGVAGSVMILWLERAGLTPDAAVLGVFCLRSGTVWFAFLLGLSFFWLWRHHLRGLSQCENSSLRHFDEISNEYERQIPNHVREFLLARKTALMAPVIRHLEDEFRKKLQGLDVGCGQGWYAEALVKMGVEMAGLDRSLGQMVCGTGTIAARRQFQPVLGSGDQLPFKPESCDFVYSINVLHHMTAPGAAVNAMREIIRVLRPGGVFFLHEINTRNPLFRFYMGYVFPLLRSIDDGTERWLDPTRLPPLPEGEWEEEIRYFTFFPDFLPQPLLKALSGVEAWLLKTPLKAFSAHYMAVFRKKP